MTARYFVDTNVLIYAHDNAAPQKQLMALELLDFLFTSGKGVISTQVLGEFFTIATRKIASPLTVAEAYAQIEGFTRSLEVLPITERIVLAAARGVRDYQINFWDAQLWAAAKINNIATILSEDFNTGATIESVRFVNPFAADFQMAELSG